MKLYYKAVTGEGKSIDGFLEARDQNEAAAYLRSKGLFPIKITRQEKNKFISSLPLIGERVKSSDIVAFTRQLASMLSSGITLLRSLEILKTQTTNRAMLDILDGLIKDVQAGSSFSRAISRHPTVFSQIYISFIEASEGSGLLDKSLVRLANTLEKQERLKASVKGALTYPIIIVIMMVVVVFIMMIFVIPQLSTLYESLSVELPWTTMILVATSNFFVNFWYLLIAGIFGGIFVFKRWYKTTEGRLLIDSLTLKLPIFGKLIQKTILTEFSRTLGSLLSSGILVVDSLKKVSDISGNIHYKSAIIDISNRVEKGAGIGDAMNLYNLFPPNLVELVRIGEQTGKLDETLISASETYEEEVDRSVKTLSTAIEPIVLVVLGAGVAFLVFSIIMPIYQIINSIA